MCIKGDRISPLAPIKATECDDRILFGRARSPLAGATDLRPPPSSSAEAVARAKRTASKAEERRKSIMFVGGKRAGPSLVQIVNGIGYLQYHNDRSR